MGEESRFDRTDRDEDTPPGGEHLVWHQDLICPGAACRGRVRRFPPGELVDGGRRERRRCPACGAVTTAPAFYRVPCRPPPLTAFADED